MSLLLYDRMVLGLLFLRLHRFLSLLFFVFFFNCAFEVLHTRGVNVQIGEALVEEFAEAFVAEFEAPLGHQFCDGGLDGGLMLFSGSVAQPTVLFVNCSHVVRVQEHA
mmetsp:Transcript_22492/g.30103  ORF Transcript_22492/g.30103 Transcript_22492/m.30103 type:complete len:108 (-) Transcript_22492:1230-1553(-)